MVRAASGREGSTGPSSIAFVLALSILLAIAAQAMTVTLKAPGNFTANTTASRNITFVYNVTWSLAGENASNCSLYIATAAQNWAIAKNVSIDDISDSNITNGSVGFSNLSYRFSSDNNYTYGIACLNFNSSSTATTPTFSNNFTLVIDAAGPDVNTTFNVTPNSTFPTVVTVLNFTANITDVIGLTHANITTNISGSIAKLNYTPSGTSIRISAAITLTNSTAPKGTVINFTAYATDTSSREKQNSTLVTVQNSAPTIPTITNASYMNVTSNRTIVWNSTDADGDAILYTVWFNGDYFSTLDSNFTTNMANDGTYLLNISAADSTGNSTNSSAWNITLDTTPPAVSLAAANANYTNGTSKRPVTVTVTDAATAANATTFATNCNTSGSFASGTAFNPFNASGTTCTGLNSTRTMNITVTDHAGNSNSSSFLLGIDDIAPTIGVIAPTSGQQFTANATFNLTANESFVRVSSFGYYLDGAAVQSNITLNRNGLAFVSSITANANLSLNLTPGTHTAIFTANDTVGNARNSSQVTFTVIGPVDLFSLNTSLVEYNTNISNFTIRNSTGDIVTGLTLSNDRTLEFFMALNATRKGVNLTINFNSSAANFAFLNFSVLQNHSASMSYLERNQTATILDYLYLNGTIHQFLPDNSSYYAKVVMPLNTTAYGIGGRVKLLYYPDETDLTTSIASANVTECSAGFSAAHTTSGACWNNTNNRTIEVFLPHFSLLALVNDSQAPKIAINTPAGTQGISEFVPNITVSPDTASCVYQLNITRSASASVPSNISNAVNAGNALCTWSSDRFRNGVYNITFNATDSAGNINQTNLVFTMSDGTAPNIPAPSAGSMTDTTAVITVTNVNETANLSVYASNGSSFSMQEQNDFNASQSLTLSSLSASTAYLYNITVCDYNGNCARNGTFSFSTSSSSSSGSSSSSSGGGGGGGAAAAPGTTAVTSSAARQWDTIPTGTTTTFSIAKDAIAVTSIVFMTSEDLKSASLTVKVLNESPASGAAGDAAYQYLEITSSNMPKSAVGSFQITFSVPASWLSAQNAGKDTVTLYRHINSEWTPLQTSLAGTGVSDYQYQATTPGFSYFAIGAKKQEGAAANATQAQEQPPTGQPGVQAKEQPPAEQPAAETGGKSWIWTALGILLLMALAGGSGFFVYRNWKTEQERLDHIRQYVNIAVDKQYPYEQIVATLEQKGVSRSEIHKAIKDEAQAPRPPAEQKGQ